ncbi:hypothetical protein STEG23_024042, partial [Scotinomys teguina]
KHLDAEKPSEDYNRMNLPGRKERCSQYPAIRKSLPKANANCLCLLEEPEGDERKGKLRQITHESLLGVTVSWPEVGGTDMLPPPWKSAIHHSLTNRKQLKELLSFRISQIAISNELNPLLKPVIAFFDTVEAVLIYFNFSEFTGTNPMISQEVSIQPQNVNENTRGKP